MDIRRQLGKRLATGGRYLWGVLILMTLVSCSPREPADVPAGASADRPSAGVLPSPGAMQGKTGVIDWPARIAENRKAGTISYMTGFLYASSSPDVNAVVADELGYFGELGLDVEIIPGIDPDGMKMLSSGQVQFASAGSASLVIQAVANDAEMKGIALMSQVGLGALMVMADSDIWTPRDLEDKTVGYKGAMPAHFKAMFSRAGANLSRINMVNVGFDPTILNTDAVDAITVFKSNEPFVMRSLGYEVRLIDPIDYGVPTSFGVVAGNVKFMESHPTAAEDFLRALLKAHEFIAAHPDEAVDIMARRAGDGYNVATERNRLLAELEIMDRARMPGFGIGWMTESHWQREIDLLADTEAISRSVSVPEVMDSRYIASLYRGEKLIWIDEDS
jgi:NitT/TauT family transport system substrate-binding protein